MQRVESRRQNRNNFYSKDVPSQLESTPAYLNLSLGPSGRCNLIPTYVAGSICVTPLTSHHLFVGRTRIATIDVVSLSRAGKGMFTPRPPRATRSIQLKATDGWVDAWVDDKNRLCYMHTTASQQVFWSDGDIAVVIHEPRDRVGKMNPYLSMAKRDLSRGA